MKYSIIRISLGLCFLAMTGCAFTQANLNVMYDAKNAQKGPLSSVKPLNIEIKEFIDERPEIDKIGNKRNGLGQKTARIVTVKPVPQIVREAFIAEFLKNGHLISNEKKDIVLSGTINFFWFDLPVSASISTTVSVDLNVINGKTGAVILTRTYQGNYNEKHVWGRLATWERITNTALERMIYQMSTDIELISALKAL